MHGTKHESFTELDAIYLLNEAKGTGVGGKLMEEFLKWADADKRAGLKSFPLTTQRLGFMYDTDLKKLTRKCIHFEECQLLK